MTLWRYSSLHLPLAQIPKQLYHTDTSKYPKLLRSVILQTIKSGGPLSVSDFMQLVNTHPKFGYYMHKEVFGDQGDFCTAPEFSQLFGEILGISLLQKLSTNLSHDNKRPICMIELGPGNGTMMLDLLRTIARVQPFYERINRCILLEKSSRLQRIQREKLQPSFPNIDFHWVRTIDEIEDDDTMKIFVSNEFFDALPIILLNRPSSGPQWREVLVDAIDVGDGVEFRFVNSPAPTPNSIFFNVDKRQLPREGGQWMEICPEAKRTCDLIAEKLSRSGGIFLAADYGHSLEYRDHPSLRAIQRHSILPSPLTNVGEADLSADVNFGVISSAFSPQNFHVYGPLTQGEFLQSFGIKERLSRLLELNPEPHLAESRERLVAGAEILLDPSKMGSIYKVVMAVTK